LVIWKKNSTNLRTLHKAKEHEIGFPNPRNIFWCIPLVVLINYNSGECTPSSSASAQAKRKKRRGDKHTELGNYFLNINQ
jgi:hypothetical protein